MSQIDISAISSLCSILDDLCPEPIASSPEVAEELDRFPEKRLREAMARVRPLSLKHVKLAMESMKMWYGVYLWMILALETNRTLFLRDFQEVRDDFLIDGESWRGQLPRLAQRCDGVVFNIVWVDAFSWQLPAADPPRRAAYLEVGEMMAATMWLEALGKLLTRDLDHETMLNEMKGIDARCQVTYQQLDQLHG